MMTTYDCFCSSWLASLRKGSTTHRDSRNYMKLWPAVSKKPCAVEEHVVQQLMTAAATVLLVFFGHDTNTPDLAVVKHKTSVQTLSTITRSSRGDQKKEKYAPHYGKPSAFLAAFFHFPTLPTPFCLDRFASPPPSRAGRSALLTGDVRHATFEAYSEGLSVMLIAA